MGASVLYTPVSNRRVVKGGSTSAWEKTKAIWGDEPILTEGHSETLRALAVADKMYADFWNDLAQLVENHGAIRLDAEF